MDNKDLLTERKFWAEYWKGKESEIIQEIDQNGMVCNILDEIVSNNKINSAVELGGFPGTFSVYLNNKYKIKSTLYDYFIDRDLFNKFLTINKVQLSEIKTIEGDLTKYELNIDNQFDLVYSIGLIEHFKNIENIIEKHTLFLNKNGKLVIVIPNFRGGKRMGTKKV